jgi:hypothetical protein
MTAAAATTNAAAPSSADQNHVKRLEKEYRKDLTARTNVKDGEMCANCFVLEKTLLDESNHTVGLMKCSRCQQIKHCMLVSSNTEKKAHKKQCQKVVMPNGESSSSSNKKSKS